MWKTVTILLILGVIVAGYAVAQPYATPATDPNTPATSGTTVTPDQKAQQCQQMTARCLLLGNQEQVILGKYAAKRAQSAEVKAFAASMVKQHTECIAKLEPLAPGSIATTDLEKQAYAIQVQLKGMKEPLPTSSETNESTGKLMTEEDQHPMQMFANIQRRMAENCIALTKSELSQVDKNDFDRAYISQQVFSHVSTLAKLMTMAPYASAELKPIIEAEEKSVRTHLDEAKSICRHLDARMITRRGTNTEK